MIGLEYILDLYNLSQQELADELGIRKQNISQWLKKDKKTPEKYLERFSKKFSIPSEYFNMELKKSDELKIKLMKLKNDNPTKKIVRKYETEEWGNYEYSEEVYDDLVAKEITLLNVEIDRQELLEEIYEMINFSYDNKIDDLKEYIDKNQTIFSVFGYIITILKSKKVEVDFLTEVFNAIVLAYGIDDEGLDIRPLVNHLIMLFCSYDLDKDLHYSVKRRLEVEKSYEEMELEKLEIDYYKKVFIDTSGKINFSGYGGLANVNDITEYTIKTGKIINGILVLEDGTFKYKNINEDKSEYILLIMDIPKLYAELLKDIQPYVEEITSCDFSFDDNTLMATTRMLNNDWVYIYNYRFEEGKIELYKNMISRKILRANLD